MLKIGEFARICGVSTQTLRYYDTAGILCPDEIDPVTGYRFYAPEKIETFRLVQTYKDAGFSLEEVKVLLQGDSDLRNVLMAMKRREISGEVKVLQAKLSMLEALGHQRKRLGEMDVFEAGKHFEDQPEVLGRWELCGRIAVHPYREPPTSKDKLEPCEREDVFPHIVLLPGGAPWWMFRWSRGVLYQIAAAYRTLIPNPFTLWEEDGIRYMTVRYATLTTLNRGGDPMWLLYRQTEHAALTDLESRAYVDDVDLPKLPDPEAEGEWVTVATTGDAHGFTLRDLPKERNGFWILGATFNQKGFCVRHYAREGGTTDRISDYTRYESPREGIRGAVLNPLMRVAEGYLIREIEGEDYLFIQHKSGDYMYGGRTPLWYVFRRTATPL